jgi:hypothetical protein
MSAGSADLARNPAGVRGTGHRGRVRGASGSAAGCWPDGRCPPRTRPPVVDNPCMPADSGSGHRPPPADTATVSDVLAELRRPGDAVRTTGWWPRSGCPVGCGTGRSKRPPSTAASGTTAGVRTAGVRPGHCRSLRVSAATGTGRLAGGCWTGPATAGRRGRAGGRAGRRAGRARRSWPAAPRPGPPGR